MYLYMKFLIRTTVYVSQAWAAITIKKCEFILQCSIKIGFILACSLYLSKESEIVVIWTLVTLGNVDSLVNNNGYISIFFLPF